MGKATILVGIGLFISMIFLIVSLGIQSSDPDSPLLASNIMSSKNMLDGEINTANDTWTFDNDYTSGSYIPTREATGEASATSTQFPDWTYSGVNWIVGAGRMMLNVIGMPYALATFMFPDSDVSAIIGAGFSALYLFIMVLLMLGKID